MRPSKSTLTIKSVLLESGIDPKLIHDFLSEWVSINKELLQTRKNALSNEDWFKEYQAIQHNELFLSKLRCAQLA